MRGWRCFTAAGLNQSLVTLRWSRWGLSSRWTSVAGAGMPDAIICSQSASGPSTERAVFFHRSWSRSTAATSACFRRTQNGEKPGSSTGRTGWLARSSATRSCQASMSAHGAAAAKSQPGSSVWT